jgi:hypothetical protein
MSDSLKHTIFTDTDCIDEQTMFDYIDKKLSAKECHVVEKHLLHCELCSDALEGLELTKNRNRIAKINQKINERIATPVDKKEKGIIAFNYKIILSVAATLLLLVGAVFFFNQVNKQNDTANMAELKEVSVPPAPPPPPPSIPADKVISAPAVSNSPVVHEKDEEPQEQTKSQATGKIEAKKEMPGQPITKPALGNSQTQPDSRSGGVANDVTSAESTIQAEETSTITPSPKASEDASGYEWRADDQKKGKDIDDKEKETTKEEKVTTSNYATSIPSSAKAPVLMDVSEDGDKNTADNKSRSKSKKKDNANAVSVGARRESSGAGSANLAQGMDAVANNASPAKTEAAMEQTPQFPGGQEALKAFIHNNYNYSLINKQEQQTNKKIVVQFTIDAKGNIKNAKITTGLNTEADKEALRVVGIMPKWKPAMAEGKAVSKEVTLPFPLQ